MLTDRVCPPARLGRHIADQAAPFRSDEGRAVSAIEGYQASIRIKIGDGAQQQRFTGAGSPPDRDTLSRR
jgi:hypothetical protein